MPYKALYKAIYVIKSTDEYVCMCFRYICTYILIMCYSVLMVISNHKNSESFITIIITGYKAFHNDL